MHERLRELRTSFHSLASRMGAPEDVRIFSITPAHDGRAHVEFASGEFSWVITERGQEIERLTTSDPDRVLYWCMRDIAFRVALSYELRHRIPGKDARRLLFGKQRELMARVNPAWERELLLEQRNILSEYPFVDTATRRPPPKKVRVMIPVMLILGVIAALAGLLWGYISQPTFTKNARSDAQVDAKRLREHVVQCTTTFRLRSSQNTSVLNACAAYIENQLKQVGARTSIHEYSVDGAKYRNVLAHFGPEKGPLLVVGAHYDAVEGTPGADDNASGVAVLLELAGLLASATFQFPVELVFYTLEEPPFFATEHMGSAIHASEVATRSDGVLGVIVLEMLGYYDDTPGSQKYPTGALKLFYPSRGNYIAVIGKTGQGSWIKRVKQGMKGTTDLPVFSLRATPSIPGIDLSDHRNYWKHDIPAVMITDTAFYRNPHYHRQTDTADTLDYSRMAEVTVGVFEAIVALAGSRERD